MRFLLKYYYQFENPIISRKNEEIYIKEGHKKYLLSEIDNPLELDEIMSVIEDNQAQKYFYNIIKTKDNYLYIQYKDKMYTLLEIQEEVNRKKIDLKNIEKIKVNNIYKEYEKINRSNWYFLWVNKNDYFFSIYNNLKSDTNEMLDYYIGMAETAVQYVNEANLNRNNQSQLYIAHKRVENDEISNPTNLVLDYLERDIAEYIKYLFYSHQYSQEKIKIVLEKIIQEKLEVELIYARVLYPTNFFDICEKELKNNSLDEINKITLKEIEAYEKYLKNIYEQLSKIKKIKKIDWL